MADERKYNEIANVNEKEKEQQQEVHHESKLTIDDNVVEKIAAIACLEVPGVLEMKGGLLSGVTETFGGLNLTKGVNAEVGEKQAAVDCSIILEYGANAVRVFDKIKESVKQQVSSMTGLDVVEVNVKVVDVMTRKEFALKNKKDDEGRRDQNELR